MTLIMPTLFETKKVFKPITTAKARNEKLESDRISLISEKYKQNNPCYLQKLQATIR